MTSRSNTHAAYNCGEAAPPRKHPILELLPITTTHARAKYGITNLTSHLLENLVKIPMTQRAIARLSYATSWLMLPAILGQGSPAHCLAASPASHILNATILWRLWPRVE